MVYNINYLEEIFTQHIINFYKMGYNFYSKCSGGSQSGEEMKIYLSNGKRILCIRIESRKCINGFFWIYKQDLVIEAFDDFDTTTLWNNRGEILIRNSFYVFDSKGKYKYIDDFELAKEIEKKKCERSRIENYFLSCLIFEYDRCSSKLYRFVKSKKGYKSIKPKNIHKVQHKVRYNGKYKYSYYEIDIDGKPSIIFNFPIDK
jgi:hypothetical protein